MEKAMVVGWGGRDDTLEGALSDSPLVSSVLRVDDSGDNQAILQLAKKYGITFVVIGPEGPLVRGMVDDFAKELLGIKFSGLTGWRLNSKAVNYL